MKSRYLLLTTVILSPILIIYSLFLFSGQPNKQNNGFIRKYGKEKVNKLNELPITGLVNRIVGFSDGRIFFNSNNPFTFYSTAFDLSTLKTLHESYDSIPYLSSSYAVFLHGGNIFIAAGNVPAVFVQNLSNNERQRLTVPFRFTRSALLSEYTLVTRTFDASGSDREFRKINLVGQNVLSKNAITEKFNDGGFATDGLLTYDPATARLFYVYFYSNEFVCMDTNLRLNYRGHTIDTVKTRAFSVASDKTHQSFTPSAPLHFVNLWSCAANGKLFVASALKADNESREQFDTSSVIDMYNLSNGGYVSSFAIPRPKGQKMKSFAIFDSLIVIIYSKKIITYKLEGAGL